MKDDLGFRIKRNHEAVWNGLNSDSYSSSDSGRWRVYAFFGTQPTAWVLTDNKGHRRRILPPHKDSGQHVVFDDGIVGYRLGYGMRAAKWRFYSVDGREWVATREGASGIVGSTFTDARWIVGERIDEPVIFTEVKSQEIKNIFTRFLDFFVKS